MCGLIGIFSNKTINFSTVKSMNNEIEHRGPDDEGYFVTEGVNIDQRGNNIDFGKQKDVNIALAFRRLSILDLSQLGHQPMNYLDRYWIVFNGEIYNHIELRDELVKEGYQFKSHSDTEVILAAYDCWGKECQNKFNGMWALAIFDIHEKTLFLSRDRFGIKPLYYYRDQNLFIFASEIKAILKHPDVISSPNVEYCQKVVEQGALEYEKNTAFENIYRFNFACSVEIGLNDVLLPFQETRYWDYETNDSDEEFNEQKAQQIAEDYYSLIKDAVRLRLRADVPFGSALSGGLDSASIVYLIEEELKSISSSYQQETFSTVHTGENTDCDESYYIKLITDFLDIKSHTIEPDVKEIEALHKKVIQHWECPFVGTGMAGINTYQLVDDSKVIVTLDGQGADEQQAGYLVYIVNFLYHSTLKSAFREAKALKAIPKASRYIKVGLIMNLARHVFNNKLLTTLFSNTKFSRYLLPLNKKLKRDSNLGLINLIHYSDSRSMLFSIESRMPFMDYRLVEFTAQIPAVYKIHNGWTKYFARRAFDKKLPDEICWRKDKMGWPMPDEKWFSGPLNQWLVETVDCSEFVQNNIEKISMKDTLDKVGVEKAIKLLNLAVWSKVFFERKIGK